MKAKNSFVAMFDFLGFKNLRKEMGTDMLHDLYKKALLAIIQHSAAGGSKSVNVNNQILKAYFNP